MYSGPLLETVLILRGFEGAHLEEMLVYGVYSGDSFGWVLFSSLRVLCREVCLVVIYQKSFYFGGLI